MVEKIQMTQDVIITAKGIRMRLIQESDAEFVVNLRTIDGSKKFVCDTVPTPEEQVQWIRTYKKREAKGEDLYFVFEDNNQKPWGTARFYRFTEDSFYFGSWISLPDNNDSIAIKAVMLGFEYMYNELGFKIGKQDTRKENKKVLKFIQLFGGEIVGEDDLSYFLNQKKKAYFANRDKILRLLKIDL